MGRTALATMKKTGPTETPNYCLKTGTSDFYRAAYKAGVRRFSLSNATVYTLATFASALYKADGIILFIKNASPPIASAYEFLARTGWLSPSSLRLAKGQEGFDEKFTQISRNIPPIEDLVIFSHVATIDHPFRCVKDPPVLRFKGVNAINLTVMVNHCDGIEELFSEVSPNLVNINVICSLHAKSTLRVCPSVLYAKKASSLSGLKLFKRLLSKGSTLEHMPADIVRQIVKLVCPIGPLAWSSHQWRWPDVESDREPSQKKLKGA